MAVPASCVEESVISLDSIPAVAGCCTIGWRVGCCDVGLGRGLVEVDAAAGSPAVPAVTVVDVDVVVVPVVVGRW